MSEQSVKKATVDLYTKAAQTPDSSLCCVSTPPFRARDLSIPPIMEEMNYGCGTTVQAADIPSQGPSSTSASAEDSSCSPSPISRAGRHAVDEPVLLETIEATAIKTPVPADGPCVFTGRTAIYVGEKDFFDDGQGHLLRRDLPLAICDKTAGIFAELGQENLILTPSTWHYQGGGCC